MMDMQTLAQFAWLIPSITLLAFVLILLQIWFGRGGRISAWTAIAGIAVSGVFALLIFWQSLSIDHFGEHPILGPSAAWLPMGAASLNFGTVLDPLSVATIAMVGVVCTMIFIYASSYMHGEFKAYTDVRSGEVDEAVGHARYGRFFAYVSLFATGMLGFVLSSNLLQALIFWEIMGLCSFLLIGFWNYKPEAAEAAKKAFLTTRIGDLFLFSGIMVLWAVIGSVDYFGDNGMLTETGLQKLVELGTIPHTSIPYATVIALLVFGGAVGKSAQFPLHVWLPDAMEGPTPVSAMIHAATMVSAGVFLVARMFPVFFVSFGESMAHAAESGGHGGSITSAMAVVAIIGAITALGAALIAVAQNDIKRVLAYSTISQLGYMIMALGIGAYVAAVFHLLTHAFFKALLFLGSGSVIHGVEHGFHHAHDHGDDHGHDDDDAAEAEREHHPPVIDTSSRMPAFKRADLDPHDPQDMRNMGGLAKRMRITYITFLLGTLALTGIPVFAGFWSKDEILAEAFHLGVRSGIPVALFVWTCGTLAAFLTAFYMSRQVFMTFWGEPSSEGAEHAPESSRAMTWPLAFLAIFAVFLGLVGVHKDFPILGELLGSNPMHDYVGYLTAGIKFETIAFDWTPVILSIVIAVLGWVVGWWLYGRNPERARAKDPLRKLRGIWTLLNRKFYVDEIYRYTFIAFSVWFAKACSWVDSRIVDGIVNGAAWVTEWFSRVCAWIDHYLVDGAVNLVAAVSSELGRFLNLMMNGRVQQYLLVAFFGLLLLLFMF